MADGNDHGCLRRCGGGKAIRAFAPFAYAPLLIPFLPYLGAPYARVKRAIRWPMLAYLVALIAAGVVKNSRSTFAEAFLALILILFMLHMSGTVRLGGRLVIGVTLCAIPALLAFNAITDLSTAMVIVRLERSQVVGVDLLERTLETYTQKDTLEAYRRRDGTESGNGYSEYYISNPLFARLITVKFDDSMLRLGTLLTREDKGSLVTLSGKKIVALLPTPVLQLLRVDISKDDISFSMGDYIYYLASGQGLGGYRTGSLTAHGLLLFGPLFYILVLALSPLVFLVLDAFARWTREGLRYAPFALIFIFQFWSLFYGDSLNDVAETLLRGLPQAVIIFWAVSKLGSVLLPAPVRRPADES